MNEKRQSHCVEGCHTRREWLKSAGCFGAAVAIRGIGIARAVTLPVAFTAAVQTGAERRYPIPPSDSVNIDRSAQLIVVRYSGHVYVFALSCPHQNNAVKWVPKEMQFQCTKHDSHYQADGVHVSGRATRNMDRYVIRRENDTIVVDLHRWVQSDKDPGGWTAAVVDV
jgi:Rieske Fe-S protein